MANPLLLRATPEEWARRRQVIDSVEKVSSFERLAGIVAQDLEALAAGRNVPDFRGLPVSVSAEFGWADAQCRWPRVTGNVAARLPAVCQRCLEPCEIEIDADFDMLLMQASETQSVDEALEVWELEQDTLRPLDMVEELLVMSMPFAAVHENAEDCGALRPGRTEPADRAQDKVRPFADLAKQIKNGR